MSSRTQRPILSIVIPTRERGRYLRHSLNTAIACKDPRVEIVVSDNASQDNTGAVVAEKGDPRIRYIRLPERVSVSRNFSSAFSNASGDYILYIGDDDAVLPSGIKDLLAILTERKPDIVSWPEVSYLWPSASEYGLLRIRRYQVRGGIESWDPAGYMQKVCDGGSGIVAVHCGCVSRELVNKVTSITGRYHYYVIPDASAFAALAFAKSYIYMHRPVTMYGRSPASNTKALQTPGSGTYTSFGSENSADAREEFLDARCRSIFAFGLDGLLFTRQLLGLSSPPINFNKWKEEITGDLISMPKEARSEQGGYVNEWLAKNEIAPIDMKMVESVPVRPCFVPMDPPKKRRRKISLKRVSIPATGQFIPAVDSAVRIAEYVIGPRSLNERKPKRAQFFAWLGIAARAHLAA